MGNEMDNSQIAWIHVHVLVHPADQSCNTVPEKMSRNGLDGNWLAQDPNPWIDIETLPWRNMTLRSSSHRIFFRRAEQSIAARFHPLWALAQPCSLLGIISFTWLVTSYSQQIRWGSSPHTYLAGMAWMKPQNLKVHSWCAPRGQIHGSDRFSDSIRLALIGLDPHTETAEPLSLCSIHLFMYN